MKKIILLLLLTFCSSYAAEKARGIFLSVGVGPRLPISSFAGTTTLGYGFNLEVSYTDNEYLPIFIFAKVGFNQYPGAQDFYLQTDYSNFSTTSLPVSGGARYYFAPLMENIVLIMPIVEASISYSYFVKLHQFKSGTGRSNFTEEISKFGGSLGAGVSMFMLEILASYNYFQSNQFVSFDLKARLPLYIVF